MIDASFSDPSQLAAHKSLAAVALRPEAIALDIPHLPSPGWRRLDLAPSFKIKLDSLRVAEDSQWLAGIQLAFACRTTARDRGRNPSNRRFRPR